MYKIEGASNNLFLLSSEGGREEKELKRSGGMANDYKTSRKVRKVREVLKKEMGGKRNKDSFLRNFQTLLFYQKPLSCGEACIPKRRKLEHRFGGRILFAKERHIADIVHAPERFSTEPCAFVKTKKRELSLSHSDIVTFS